MFTSDPFILECVSGCKIGFVSFPEQSHLPHPMYFTKVEKDTLGKMIDQFEKDHVIQKCHREEGDYVNNVFLREKRQYEYEEKKYRLILNVKQLNTHVEYIHFKMDTL